MTDWTKEEDEAFNMVEQNSNLGKQILRDSANKSSGMDCCTYDCIQGRDCPVRKAQWKGLNWGDMPDEPYIDSKFLMGVRWAEEKLKNKNT
jgi:hypothetical protein